MGLGGISIWQLLIILVIVVMVFGTKKLRNMGGDLGSAVKGFKKSVKEEPGSDAKIEGDPIQVTESDGSSASEMTEETTKQQDNT